MIPSRKWKKSTEFEKIFASDKSCKELVCGDIPLITQQLLRRKWSNFKMAKNPNRYFSKEDTEMDSKHRSTNN